MKPYISNKIGKHIEYWIVVINQLLTLNDIRIIVSIHVNDHLLKQVVVYRFNEPRLQQ